MTFDPDIFRRSRTPIYLQIAKLLRQRIEQGEWKMGDQLPTLDALMATYGVARSTLREALARLEAEGLIRRGRGTGTFVTKDLSSQRWFKLPISWPDMLESVADLRVRPLPVPADERAGPLPVDFVSGVPATSYVHLRRVHYRLDVAYCLIDIHLAADLFETDPGGFTTTPVLSRLAARPGLGISVARQVIWVSVSDEMTASCLDIGVGDPVVEIRRALADENGRIIYYAHIRYPAELVRLEVDLLGKSGAGPKMDVTEEGGRAAPVDRRAGRTADGREKPRRALRR
jgi:GntR family transcriptional regulator